MYALILSIALCGVGAGDRQVPTVMDALTTIEMIDKLAGVDSVQGVMTLDRSGYVLGIVVERVPRPLGHRGRYSTPGAWAVLPTGVCDDKDDCKKKIERLCKDAGHGGAKEETVDITPHDDGGATCSGDCKHNGAVAFVTCGPAKP